MQNDGFPQINQKFEIQEYKRPKNHKELPKTHVAFSGAPYKHPFDVDKIILVVDPFSTHTFYHEFKTQDIAYAEDLGNIVTVKEETVAIVRIWVKKGSVGVQCTPFVVSDVIRR